MLFYQCLVFVDVLVFGNPKLRTLPLNNMESYDMENET
jgi:hypothetical protein